MLNPFLFDGEWYDLMEEDEPFVSDLDFDKLLNELRKLDLEEIYTSPKDSHSISGEKDNHVFFQVRCPLGGRTF